MATRSKATTDDGAVKLLADPRFELLPFSSFDEQLTYLPEGATVAITSSPEKSIMETVERTEQAAAKGFEIVPHIAARNVQDREQLEEIVERLDAAGVEDVFVPGGDNDEPGEFESAYELLVALDEMDHPFEQLGITGYPEGHYFIDDETLWEHLEKKEPYADYIITQICYDPEKVVDWVEETRARGIELPVEVGVPGVMKYQKLLNISQQVGVGDSISFLRKTTGVFGFVKQLIGSRGKYTPDELIQGIAPYVDDPEYDFTGVHLYTMNQAPDTEEWRQGYL